MELATNTNVLYTTVDIYKRPNTNFRSFKVIQSSIICSKLKQEIHCRYHLTSLFFVFTVYLNSQYYIESLDSNFSNVNLMNVATERCRVQLI